MEYTRFHNLTEFQQNLVRVVFLYRYGLDYFRNKPSEMLSKNYYIDTHGLLHTVYIERNDTTYRVEDHGTHYRVRDSDKRRDAWDNWQTIIKVS